MITLLLATRMAFSADPRARWRQISVILSVFTGLLLVLTATSVSAGVIRSEADLRNRSPVWASDGEVPALVIRARAIIIDGIQVPVTWLVPGEAQPTPGYTIIPPGLDRLPGPGEMVLSPVLLGRGIDAPSLGMVTSAAGAGGGPAIGPDGLATMSEPFIYARPREGQSLGREGALLPFRGYGQDGPKEPSGWTTQPPLIGSSIAPFMVVLLLLVPALVLLVLGGRALSPTRIDRAATLIRLGVARNRVRRLLALETAVLAVPGVMLGFVVWWLGVSRATYIPGASTILKAGTLAVPLSVTIPVVGAAVAVAAASSSVVPRPRDVHRPRPVRWGELLPLLGGAILVISAWIGRFSGTMLGVGALLLLVGVLLAAPKLTAWLGTAMSRQRIPRLWLAGRRLSFTPRNSSRPAALLAAMTLVGCSSVAVYGTLWKGQFSGKPGGAQSAAYVDWVGAQSTQWTDVMAAADAVGAAVLPVRRGDDGQVSVDPKGCSPAASPSCTLLDAKGFVSGLTSSGLQLAASSDRLDPQAALIIRYGDLSDSTIYRALTPVAPALNVHRLTGTDLAAPLYFRWLLIGWLITTAAMSLAVLREIGDRVMQVTWADRQTMVRSGMREDEIVGVSRLETLLPMLLGAVLGFLAGCLLAFAGRTNRLTVVDLPALTLYFLVSALAASLTAICVLRMIRVRQI